MAEIEPTLKPVSKINSKLKSCFLLITTFSISLLVQGNATANWFAENDVALGIEGGSINSGLSIKVPYSRSSLWQITLGGGGDVNGVGIRYIHDFKNINNWRLLWHGGVSTEGIGAGIGADYDLTTIGIPVPVLISFTFGSKYEFGDDRGFDFFDFGLGFYYRFR